MSIVWSDIQFFLILQKPIEKVRNRSEVSLFVISKTNDDKSNMNKELELIKIIKDNLKELEKEAYGERRHGNKEMPPSIYHFHIYFKRVFNAVYELGSVEGQKYFSEGDIRMIYDVERDIEGVLSYYEKAKKPFSDMSEECYLKILGNLSCIINKND